MPMVRVKSYLSQQFLQMIKVTQPEVLKVQQQLKLIRPRQLLQTIVLILLPLLEVHLITNTGIVQILDLMLLLRLLV